VPARPLASRGTNFKIIQHMKKQKKKKKDLKKKTNLKKFKKKKKKKKKKRFSKISKNSNHFPIVKELRNLDSPLWMETCRSKD